MAQEIIQCERMGINPKWPKYKKIAASFNLSDRSYEDMQLANIREYISREDANRPPEQIPNRRNITHGSFDMLSRGRVSRALALAPDTPDWLNDAAHWLRYYQVSQMQKFFWHHRFNILFPNHPNGGLFSFSMEAAANMMAVMAILGWKDAVLYQGYLTHAALNRSYQLQLQYEEEHRRAQAFMLRLFADWVGDVSHQWPAYAYDEPIYETLLAHWRTPDPQDLVPCLLAACDRHTHSSGKNTLKKFYDFSENNDLYRVPVGILHLFRLREWEGLKNPVLDHPLMAPPFDQLLPEQPVPELDELMQGILKRAREDWPQYDEVLSLRALMS
ncbi:MAG: hypothetical protein PHH36_10060 [Sideroxydans sp.]|nr:hypothetical protein [Sideroxydans sp.]